MRLIISILIIWAIISFAVIPLVSKVRKASKRATEYIDKQYNEKGNCE